MFRYIVSAFCLICGTACLAAAVLVVYVTIETIVASIRNRRR